MTDNKNMFKIQEGVYLVKTPAGLKKAIREVTEGKKYDIAGYPESYPCVVNLCMRWSGYGYLKIKSVDVNTLMDIFRTAEVIPTTEKPAATYGLVRGAVEEVNRGWERKINEAGYTVSCPNKI